MIHPSAVVSSEAEIGSNVNIGPFAVIEDCVKIESDTDIGSHVVVRSGTKIGKKNKIYSFASIGEDPQYSAYKGENTYLIIGDNNTIREYVTLNRGSTSDKGTGLTRIGDNNFIMAYCHIAHDSILGDNIVFANGASLAGHVEVGDYAILGGFTLVHQFCRVGAHSLTGIGTVCLKDVAPFVIAAGNPAKYYGINTRGLRRRNFSEDVISDLRRTYKKLFRSDDPDALQYMKNDLQTRPACDSPTDILTRFCAESDRGLIR